MIIILFTIQIINLVMRLFKKEILGKHNVFWLWTAIIMLLVIQTILFAVLFTITNLSGE
jgi:hypothetical protein